MQSVRQDRPKQNDLEFAKRACSLHETLGKFQGPIAKRRDLVATAHYIDSLGHAERSNTEQKEQWSLGNLPFASGLDAAPGGQRTRMDEICEDVGRFFSGLGNVDCMPIQFGALCSSTYAAEADCKPAYMPSATPLEHAHDGSHNLPRADCHGGEKERETNSSDRSGRATEKMSAPAEKRGVRDNTNSEDEMLLAMLNKGRPMGKGRQLPTPRAQQQQIEEMLPEWMRG